MCSAENLNLIDITSSNVVVSQHNVISLRSLKVFEQNLFFICCLNECRGKGTSPHSVQITVRHEKRRIPLPVLIFKEEFDRNLKRKSK